MISPIYKNTCLVGRCFDKELDETFTRPEMLPVVLAVPASKVEWARLTLANRGSTNPLATNPASKTH